MSSLTKMKGCEIPYTPKDCCFGQIYYEQE